MNPNENITVQSLEQVYNQIRKTQTEVLKTLNNFNTALLKQQKNNLKSFYNLQKEAQNTIQSTGGQKRVKSDSTKESKDEGFFKTFAKEFNKRNQESKREAKEMKEKLQKSNEYLSQIPKEKDGFFKSLLKAAPYLLAAIPLLPALTDFAKNSFFPMMSKLIPDEFKPILNDLGTVLKDGFDKLIDKMAPYIEKAKEWIKDSIITILKSPETWQVAGGILAIKMAPAIVGSLVVALSKTLMSSVVIPLGKTLLTSVVIPLGAKLLPALAPILPALAPLLVIAGTMTSLYQLTKKAQEAKEAAKQKVSIESDKIKTLQSQIDLEKSKGESANAEKIKIMEEALESRKQLEESKKKEVSLFAPFINAFQKDAQNKLEAQASQREDKLFLMMQAEKKELFETLKISSTEEGKKIWEMAKTQTQNQIELMKKEGKLRDGDPKADIELGIQTQILRQISNSLSSGSKLEDIAFADSNSGSESSTIMGSSPMKINSPSDSNEKLNYIKLVAKAREAERKGQRNDNNVSQLMRQAKLIPKGQENSYLNRIEALQSGANQFVGSSLGLNSAHSAISSGFGHRLFPKSPLHRGWDFLTPEGTKLKSPFNMKLADLKSGGAGGNEAIFNINGYRVGFSHLQRSLLSKKDIGKTIPQGETFAYTGNTGRSAGPHLHLGIRDEKGSPVNFLGSGANLWKNLMGVEADVDEKKKFRASSVDPLSEMLGELDSVFGENKNLKNSVEALKFGGLSNLVNMFGGQMGGLGSLNFDELIGPLNNIAKNTKRDSNVIF